jgi:hypothetical protein
MPVRPESEARMLEACISVLSLEAIDGLQKLLTPEAIQAATRSAPGAQGVSRHTVYRRWPDRSEAIRDVADFLADPAINGSLNMFAATGSRDRPELREQELEARRRAPLDPDAARKVGIAGFRWTMGTSLEFQLSSLPLVANWVLHAAATTSSLAWRGPRPKAADEKIGRRILADRAASHDEIIQRWSDPLRRALSALGRRPRPGFTVEDISQLILNTYLGCLHQIFGDPQLNDDTLDTTQRETRLEQMIDIACEAMFELTWAFSEPGSFADPRRPIYDTRDETSEIFDRIVDAAARLYTGTNITVVDPAVAAEAADVAVEMASGLFPTPGDLADSVLRRLVAPSDQILGQSATVSPLPTIATLLYRLSQAAERRPALVTATRLHAPTSPADATALLDELRKRFTDALRSSWVTCRAPAKTAERLIGFALEGASGLPAIEAMLELLESSPDTPGPSRGRAGGEDG